MINSENSGEKNPKKCQLDGCKIKLKLTDYKCKCNKIYCTTHRFPETHMCTYNYKLDGSKILEKNLIKVNGTKIDLI